MSQIDWQPSAELDTLRARAEITQRIRKFFYDRQVLEVETPVMSQSTVTDIHLHTFKSHFVGPEYSHGQDVYLMTSPEFHMKRLLAAGSGSIYQISKVFRNEESGQHHNPEFSMLEWYRVGFNHHDLMDEMAELLIGVLQCEQPDRMTYQHAFEQYTGLCPLEAELSQLKKLVVAHSNGGYGADEEDRDTLLQYLFSFVVEPNIGQQRPVFIYDFPASQAALAKINCHDSRVAERFEVYYQGIELANGFHELDNAQEQRQRFLADNEKRAAMGLIKQPIDEHFLSSLAAGLPACAGVALGVDRLMMMALKKTHIAEVLAFAFPRA